MQKEQLIPSTPFTGLSLMSDWRTEVEGAREPGRTGFNNLFLATQKADDSN